jgi:hypothetical protein
MPLPLLLAAAIAAAPAALSEEARALAELNERVLRAYVLDHDVRAYAELAHPAYKIVVAPGFVENREMVLSTASNIALRRFDMRTLSVDIVGDTALIVTGVEAEGAVAGRPFPPRLTMMHVYVREGGAWRLLGRSMTPVLVAPEILDRANAAALGRN